MRDPKKPFVYRSSRERTPAGATPVSHKAQSRVAQGSSRQFRINLLIGCLIGLLAVIIVLAAMLPGCLPAGTSASTSAAPASGSALVEDSSYDMTQNSLPASALQGTILGPTEDAGDEYVKDTLFLGDSNTARLLEYALDPNISLNNCIGVEGMGIQSVLSNNCVKFSNYGGAYNMAQAVAILQPRRVVITFGTNNAGATSTEGFITAYGQVLDAIEESYPYADIIIAAVPPIAQRHDSAYLSMSTIDKFNLELAKLAEQRDLKFLNWSETLKDPSTGYVKSGYTVSDGIHITKDGFAAMLEYYRTHAYITDDTRPKPLNDIPQRLAIPRPVTSSSSSSSSSSKTEVEVPFCANLSRGDVQALLNKAGLQMAVVEVYSATVAKGLAMAQTPDAGTMVAPGTTVTVTFSLGPQPAAAVPTCVGLDQGTATSQLTALGFNYAIVTMNSDAPAGTVIAQDQPAGTTLPAGSVVTLTVSLGPAAPPPETTPPSVPPPASTPAVPPSAATQASSAGSHTAAGG